MILLLIVSVNLFAYENGDYMARKSGYWKQDKMWKVFQNGQWLFTNTDPSGVDCNIYIPSGIHVYITYYEDDHSMESITITKKLIIQSGGNLTGSNYSGYAIINLYGDIQVDGELGINFCYYEFDPSIIINAREGEYGKNRIYGDGGAYIGFLKLYNDCEISTMQAQVMETNYKRRNITFAVKNYTKFFREINVFGLGNRLEIYDKLIVRHEIHLSGGNSFENAATINIYPGGELSFFQTNNYHNIILGENGKYSKLIVKGTYREKAIVDGFDNSSWELTYSNDDYYGNNVMIDADNAIFKNMKKDGLVIRSGVNIKDNKMDNCKFEYSFGDRNKTLLNIIGNRNLDLHNATFINDGGYNITKFSRYGIVRVYNYHGNLSGENNDRDPFNTILWYSSGKSAEDVSTEKLAFVYPNPFNPTTTIYYNLPFKTAVNLNIYNLKGEIVKKLVNEYQSKGKHSVVWSGINNNGKRVTSGTYLYKIRYNDQTELGKIIILK